MANIDRFVAFNSEGPLGQPPHGYTWEALMLLSLNEAKLAARRGEIPVGAVLISSSGIILAKSGNMVENNIDPTAHAEMMVLRSASKKLRTTHLTDSILIVTLEPCLMCAGAIIEAGISGIVYGASDQIAGAISSTIDFFNLPGASRRFWHLGGILSCQCAELLTKFFTSLRQKRYLNNHA